MSYFFSLLQVPYQFSCFFKQLAGHNCGQLVMLGELCTLALFSLQSGALITTHNLPRASFPFSKALLSCGLHQAHPLVLGSSAALPLFSAQALDWVQRKQ